MRTEFLELPLSVRRSGLRLFGGAWARQDCPRCARRYAVLTRPARPRLLRRLPERHELAFAEQAPRQRGVRLRAECADRAFRDDGLLARRFIAVPLGVSCCFAR